MHSHSESIALELARGPLSSADLQRRLSLSQATVSRALAAMGPAVVRIGAGRSVSYAWRDDAWPEPVPVYRVSAEGQLVDLGALVPVRPAGFVMQPADGVALHSEDLPWWLVDMRPQGFLGRAFALRHAQALSLPASISDWSNRHVLRAWVAHGRDAVGNLLLGEAARLAFLQAEPPRPIGRADRPEQFAHLAQRAAEGELPGSSAGGEQAKFLAFVASAQGPRHVIVKYSQPSTNAVAARWRDLLLAEHLALQALREAGVSAASTEVVDHGPQRFLQVERFDRVGVMGRRALHSLGSLDDEFVGDRQAPWPVSVQQLVNAKVVSADAQPRAALLYAYGLLIGNTDMHMGNLSFLGEQGRPYALAPAYDMLPMAFAPTSSGAMRNELPELVLPACVPPALWHQALGMAEAFAAQLGAAIQGGRVSSEFVPCHAAIAARLARSRVQIARLDPRSAGRAVAERPKQRTSA